MKSYLFVLLESIMNRCNERCAVEGYNHQQERMSFFLSALLIYISITVRCLSSVMSEKYLIHINYYHGNVSGDKCFWVLGLNKVIPYQPLPIQSMMQCCFLQKGDCFLRLCCANLEWCYRLTLVNNGVFVQCQLRKCMNYNVHSIVICVMFIGNVKSWIVVRRLSVELIIRQTATWTHSSDVWSY